MGRVILAVLALCCHAVLSDQTGDITIPDLIDSPPFPTAEATVADPDWITWAGKFEGDIQLTPLQERQLNATIANGTERNAIRNTAYKWPSGRVPYVFTNVFSESEKNIIRRAFAQYAAKTCIQFVERNGERDYIELVKKGCWSYVGRTGLGKQGVSLSGGCVHEYIVIHELMHAIGFYHEQSRYDRDQYVRVNWANIRNGRENNFRKQSSQIIQHLDEPYDYKSIMHYEEYDFSTNYGVLKTIEALDGTSPLGNNVGFTQIDINKINKLYSCSTTSTTTTTPPPATCENQMRGNCNAWGKSVCTNEKYKFFMMDACADFCGYCPGRDCFDKHEVICKPWADAGVCTMSIYRAWMKEFCPKSCGAC